MMQEEQVLKYIGYFPEADAEFNKTRYLVYAVNSDEDTLVVISTDTGIMHTIDTPYGEDQDYYLYVRVWSAFREPNIEQDSFVFAKEEK